MNLQQSRFEVVDAYIVRADDSTPVTGLDETTLLVRLKKKGEYTFTSKTFFEALAVLGDDLSISDTVVYFDDDADLDSFPVSGRLWFDKGGLNEEGPLAFTRHVGLDYLTLSSGVSAGHLTGEDIMIDDFWEVGYGTYSFLLSPTDTDTLGEFVCFADPVDTDYKNYIKFYEIVPATVSGVAPETVSFSNCLIYGYVIDIHGQPLENVGVAFRIIGEPELTDNAGVSERVYQTNTNEDGYFEATLLQGIDAYVTIPEISYYKVITIPESDSAQLFDL